MKSWFRCAARLVFAFFAASSIATAASPQAYDEGTFKAAQAAGKPIVVEIHADWCGECKMQHRVLDKLSDEPSRAGLLRLRVDYDRQKDIVRAFNARKQSTLVVFKGGKEVARAVGITAEDQIRALIDKAI